MPSYSANTFLAGLNLAEVLSQFASSGTYYQRLTEIFGNGYDPIKAQTLRQQWQARDFSRLPDVAVVDDNALGNVSVLYIASTDTLYLSRQFLNTATPEQLSTFLLEEIGHRIDEYLKTTDTPGDEGELFANIILENRLTPSELQRIRTENDTDRLFTQTQLAPIILTVNTTDDQNDGSAANGLSLRDAILIANADPTRNYEIQLVGGRTYSLTQKGREKEDAAFTGDLDIVAGRNLKIISTGTGNAIIDASAFLNDGGFQNPAFPDRVFEVLDSANLTLEKITVQGGSFSGIIIQANGTVTLTNSIVRQNSVQTPHFSQGVVTPMAGGITNYGNLTLTNSFITSNRTDQIDSFGSGTNGGGLRNYGTATLTNTTINNNNAGRNYDGGGIYNEGTLTLTNVTITDNKSGSKGNGIYNAGTATIHNSIIRNNTFIEGAIINEGGGIYNTQNLTITDSQIINNTAKENAGGLWNSVGGQVNLTATLINNNQAQGGSGGGIANLGTLTGRTVSINQNSARNDRTISYVGGIVNGSNGTLTLIDSSINNNTGGGFFNDASFDGVGNATLTNTTVNNNTSAAGTSAIFTKGRLILDRVTVQGNTVTDVNSAVAIALDGLDVNARITNSTIRGNTGIGIQNKALSQTVTDSLILTNSTIENNTGHGIENDDYMTVTGSIIQNNGKTGIVNVDGFVQVNGFQILYLIDSTVRGNGEGGISNGLNNFLYSLRSTIENHTGTGITNNGIAAIYNNTIRNNTIRGIQTGFSSPLIYRPVFVNWPGIDQDGNTSQTLVFNSAIHDNGTFSTDWGGGINNRGSLTLLNSAIYSNRATEGAGIHNAGSFTTEVIEREPDGIDNDNDGTIDNEQNPVRIIYYPARLIAENTTISGNRATGNGGGLTNASIASGTVTNTTITNNTADSDNDGNGSGGGLFNADNNVANDYRITARNTIIAGNFDTPNNTGAGAIHRDISGSAIGNNRNLIGNIIGASGSIGTGNDIVNPNPLLGALGNNGGVILTHGLLAGSPALNAGNNALAPLDRLDEDRDSNTTEAYPFDGRGTGFNRIFGSAIDIGAFEAQVTFSLPSITLALSPASVTEDGTPNLIYTFTRTGATTNPLTVTYTIGGTATNGTDYATIPTTVTFAAGSATATVTVNPTADTTVEANETVVLTLANGTGYTRGTTTAVTGTITNDDTSVTLAVFPAGVTEDGATNLVYTFTRTGITTNALTVNYTVGGTATLNTDYTQTGAASFTATTGTVTFAAGSATATVTVNPTADTTVEANETVVLTLANGTGYTRGTTTAVTGTITNDDTSVTLAVSPASVTEDGTPNLIYTFIRTGATTSALTVNYTIGGTATLNTDYTRTGTNNTVTFAAGASTATVTVNPTADTVVEANETVTLTLATGTGYTIGTTAPVTGTITNDDLPSLSFNNVIVVEGRDTAALITVSLSTPSPRAVSVNYTTTPVTATANSDYTPTSGTLTIPANSTSATFSIPILNDNVNEPNETFTVSLSNPVNATLATTSRSVTITDTLESNVTTTLSARIENLRLTGTATINGTGNAGNNILTGNSANNTLAGLDGNDTYVFVANSPLGLDTVNETTTGGTDTLNFQGTNGGIRVNLGNSNRQTVLAGNLTLKLSASNVIENAIGGNGNDRITGNGLVNNLFGNLGNDTIDGGTGADYLDGGAGNDIIGGGSGNDRFAYATRRAFAIGDIGLDTLLDFTPASDKIVLSKTTFTALTSVVGNGFSQATNFAVVDDDALADTSAALIVYSRNSGSLFYNANGTTSGLGTGAEFAILFGNPTITGSDFTIAL